MKAGSDASDSIYNVVRFLRENDGTGTIAVEEAQRMVVMTDITW